MEPLHTHAIVLYTTNYTSSKKIVHLLTPDYGKLSCIVSGISSKKGKALRAYLQPSNQIQCVVIKQSIRQNLYQLKEVSLIHSYQSIPYDVMKSSQAFFLCESMNRLTVEEDHAIMLYEFVSNAFNLLDVIGRGAENFHIVFLFQLIKIQGYELTKDYLNQYLSLNEIESSIYRCEQLKFDMLSEIRWNRGIRNRWIEVIIIHIERSLNISLKIKSLDVLKQIFA
ncbi:DNA repair protein RecO [Halosquirtibacter xylanolyticus]|uniref:DNA repair protein RecO n=1 Tax=Halosquirtibacter xylanolyticus TaxID=3374599 RepID=UPI003749B41E|nr:DNA repair protein RecO [Prolixibacteraceae bacterium]